MKISPRLLDEPWDDPQWRAQKESRFQQLIALDVEAARQLASILQTYDKAPRRDWRKHATPCFGYWQSHDDRTPLSTVEDEAGL